MHIDVGIVNKIYGCRYAYIVNLAKICFYSLTCSYINDIIITSFHSDNVRIWDMNNTISIYKMFVTWKNIQNELTIEEK